MLKRRTLHRDMADVNVYTARRLKSMALSLGGLAQAFADEIGGQGHLTKEDGLAAMQTAASAVCGDCTRCNLYYGSRRDDSYYLYYLLRTFEQKGKIDLEDMPRLFHEICSQREAYLRELNRSLGRATMNLGWKNRFLESRDAVIVQFRELAAILEEFSNQMEQAADVTASWEEVLSGILRRSHLRVDNMLVLQYENQQKEAFLTLRSVNGRCMTARDVAELLGRAIAGSHWSVAKDSKSLITRNAATFRFVEEGKYRMVYGMACSLREGEPISGDTCTVQTGLPGQVIMSLSDGMGSGRSASEDSEKVIELTQRLLETGFSARSALKLVNTVLLLAGTEQNPATIDLCCIDLGTGVLEAMKLGAVPTFILGREGVEFLEAGGLPMGIVQNAEPVLMSRKMWDGEKIIMISDGILEAMPGEHKEETFMEFVSNLSGGNPQELAEQILANIDDYVASTVEGLQEKADAAKEVLANATTQAEIDEAVKSLREARLNARTKADTSALEEIIAYANSLDLAGYAAESRNMLDRTIAAVKRVLADPEATQEEVDQAVQTMQTAIDSLQLVENSAGSTNADTTNTAAAAQTAAFAGMLAVSAAGIFLFRRKRQMK